MRLNNPFVGILAFIIVLLTMPLGHTAMILMEKGFGHENVFIAAIALGCLGVILLILGLLSKNQTSATFLGLFSGLFIWTGWIEFSFVYYANRYAIPPLMENGVVVTKPEYLIMPSSVGFWAVIMLYYFLGSNTACKFFTWFQKKLSIQNVLEMRPSRQHTSIATMMEMITLLWTFYLLLLFVYDKNFFGDRHFVTYVVAFGSLLWSLLLFRKLIKIKDLSYAIKYSIPTVVIFWNFVEILGRWEFFHEIWIEPQAYWLEMTIMTAVFGVLVWVSIRGKHKKAFQI